MTIVSYTKAKVDTLLAAAQRYADGIGVHSPLTDQPGSIDEIRTPGRYWVLADQFPDGVGNAVVEVWAVSDGGIVIQRATGGDTGIIAQRLWWIGSGLWNAWKIVTPDAVAAP